MSRCRRTLIYIGLAALVAAAFWPVLRCQFVRFDDPGYVTENYHVQQGITFENVIWALKDYSASNWHPLTWLSLMLDCQIYGLRPWGHHLTNLLIHIASTLVLFAALRRMTDAEWPSALVAALFGIHPLHVESVAWIAERKDVLSAFFWMVTLWCYARYAQKRATTPHPFWKSAYYYAALVAFLFGLMSKAMIVTGPCVLLLLDYWPLKRLELWGSKPSNSGALFFEKVPFFCLTIATSVVTFWAQKVTGAVKDLSSLPIDQRLINALVSYGRYLLKTIWPTHLAIQYPHPGTWPIAYIVGSAAAMIVFTWAAASRMRTQPWLIIGWLWFVGTLVPVIGLVQVGDQAMADRFSYIPSIGLFIAVAFSLNGLASRLRAAAKPIFVAALVAVMACAFVTHAQTQNWRNSETLFRHSVEVTDRNLLAYNNLGRAVEDNGRIDEALQIYQQGLQIDPKFAPLQSNLGLLLMNRGELEEAKSHLSEAVRIDPGSPLIQYNWGKLQARLGNMEGAVAAFQRALQLQNHFAKAQVELAGCYATLGRTNEAMAEYELALNNQRSIEALNNFGEFLTSQGTPDRALPLLIEARRMDPNRADVHNNLANCLTALNKPNEAFTEYEVAIRLNPTNAIYHFNLGNLLVRCDRYDDAIASYRKGIQQAPEDIDLRSNLAAVLAHQNRIAEAIDQYTAALKSAKQARDSVKVAQIQAQLDRCLTRNSPNAR